MGDTDYKPMKNSTNAGDYSLSIPQAVAASAASLRDQVREIVGSEPIIESNGNSQFTLATYGAGKYCQISSFSIAQFPGCCGIAVFYHASVAADFQSKGLGALLLRLREEAARKAGFTFAQATVLKTNKRELSILSKAGWEVTGEFENRRTRNVVLVLGKALV